tara:strand:+ start:1806 stop:2327 length:522 start_codon:yes stop_codon:yes gene_type:complete
MSRFRRTTDNPEKFRENVVSKLNSIIDDKKISENLEKGIYNYTLSVADTKNLIKKWNNDYFVLIYIQKLKTILCNLLNKDILTKLVSKSFKAHKLAYMTHQELRPDLWDELIELKKIKDENKFSPKIEASTDDFTCFKCKSKKCTFYQLQTRSGDEPMTTFVTCIDCGNRWRF